MILLLVLIEISIETQRNLHLMPHACNLSIFLIFFLLVDKVQNIESLQIKVKKLSVKVLFENSKGSNKTSKCNSASKTKVLATKRGAYGESYSEDDLNAALLEIKNGAGKKSTARKYGIPSSTLFFRISDKFMNTTRRGPEKVMTDEEEKEVVDWIMECSTMGCPRKSKDIRKCAQEIILRNERKTPFKNSKPSKTWFRCFFRRHPEIIGHTAATSSVQNGGGESKSDSDNDST